jgi:hypothetical protein
VVKKYQASQKNSYPHLLLQLAHGGMALLLLFGLLIKPPPMARVLVMTNAHALHLQSLDAPHGGEPKPNIEQASSASVPPLPFPLVLESCDGSLCGEPLLQTLLPVPPLLPPVPHPLQSSPSPFQSSPHALLSLIKNITFALCGGFLHRQSPQKNKRKQTKKKQKRKQKTKNKNKNKNKDKQKTKTLTNKKREKRESGGFCNSSNKEDQKMLL